MRAGRIDGAAVARAVRDGVARDVLALAAAGVVPGLTVVVVGDDPASHVYVRGKEKASTEVGMRGDVIALPANATETTLLARIDALNADPSVHGILVQMPLPPQIDARRVIRRISPDKDVDGFHPVNVGRLNAGDADGFAPCTPLGVMELLARSDVPTAGRDAVVIGRSNIVGRPMATLLSLPGADATVTICHSRTHGLATHVRRADIVVSAVGRPRTITADMVKPGAVVIDVGMNRVDDPASRRGYRLEGDVDFDGVARVASLITPVPGGVGPMTIAMLLRNTVRAATRASSPARLPAGVRA